MPYYAYTAKIGKATTDINKSKGNNCRLDIAGLKFSGNMAVVFESGNNYNIQYHKGVPKST